MCLCLKCLGWLIWPDLSLSCRINHAEKVFRCEFHHVALKSFCLLTWAETPNSLVTHLACCCSNALYYFHSGRKRTVLCNFRYTFKRVGAKNWWFSNNRYWFHSYLRNCVLQKSWRDLKLLFCIWNEPSNKVFGHRVGSFVFQLVLVAFLQFYIEIPVLFHVCSLCCLKFCLFSLSCFFRSGKSVIFFRIGFTFFDA